ncbi:MAG: flagellar hook-basal body complex protein FliE [Actinobacteria bacterium 69-20]|mgnify:FL=1|nr:flagellar hook-basal body complex protein FliE [Actinomycetota bacterium]OJV27833.1 MAG: flagellar hook-basal body complex protein FliE [Actinobacteria bacterium 69-20]
MTSPIAPIGSISPLTSSSPVAGMTTSPAGSPAANNVMGAGNSAGSTKAGGLDFAQALANGFDTVNAAQANANQLAVQAATGQLVDPAQLTIATTKAQMLTQLAAAVQSKAVAAFNTIMSMQA